MNTTVTIGNTVAATRGTEMGSGAVVIDMVVRGPLAMSLTLCPSVGTGVVLRRYGWHERKASHTG